MEDIEGERLEEEPPSSPPLLLTGPVHPSDLMSSPGVSEEGCEQEGETAKGCLEGGADSGLSMFFVCGPDGLMELEKTSEREKYKDYKFPRIAKSKSTRFQCFQNKI